MPMNAQLSDGELLANAQAYGNKVLATSSPLKMITQRHSNGAILGEMSRRILNPSIMFCEPFNTTHYRFAAAHLRSILKISVVNLKRSSNNYPIHCPELR